MNFWYFVVQIFQLRDDKCFLTQLVLGNKSKKDAVLVKNCFAIFWSFEHNKIGFLVFDGNY